MKRLPDNTKTKLKSWERSSEWQGADVSIVTKLHLYVLASIFPKLLSNGHLEDKQLNYIVMPRYDIDLERLFQLYKRKFKLETVVTIGIQMIERLEIMHNCGLVHNDLKPQNIMAHLKQN